MISSNDLLMICLGGCGGTMPNLPGCLNHSSSRASKIKNAMHAIRLLVGMLGVIAFSCGEASVDLPEEARISFGPPQAVTLEGYQGHIMEPFVSRDGKYLFFNNLNAPSENTNLHWGTRLQATRFQYQGEIANVNTLALEGVPSMDVNQAFYFVHTGSYDTTLSTLYRGVFSEGRLQEVQLLESVSNRLRGWVNFDLEVSYDGQTLYFVDGRFDAQGGPHEADLVMARKQGDRFVRLPESDYLLQHINTHELEYAAALTRDELEICFTRVAAPLSPTSLPRIYLARRKSREAPFDNVQQIKSLSGFVEAPTYSPDDQSIYVHKKEGNRYRLYVVSKLEE